MKTRAYLGVCRIHFLRLNQYRFSSINDILSTFFYGFIQVSILIAFYTFGNTSHIGITIRQAVTYAWLSQAIHAISPVFQDSELQQQITTGGFVYDLCRPIDLYAHWFSKILAFRFTPLILYIPSISIIALLLPGSYRLLPPSLSSLLLAIAALAAALLMSTSLSCILTTLCIHVELGRGPVTFLSFVISLLSGGEVPLPILPEQLVRLLRWLPFSGIFDTPCSLYLGLVSPSVAALFIVRQLAWTAIIVFLGRKYLNNNLRRVIVQGG